METIKENLIVDSRDERRSIDNNKFISFSKIFCIDFFLLNFSFFICYLIKRGDLDLTGSYSKLLFLFYLCWFVASIMGKKFKPSSYVAYGTGILTFLRSSLYLTYLITLLVVVFGFAVYSRVHIFSTCLMVLVLECLVWFVYNTVFNSRATDKLNFKNILESIRMESNISWSLIFMDLFLVVAAFFMVNYFKRGHLALLPDYS